MPDSAAVDRDVAVLRSSAAEWVTTPLAEKRGLLEEVRAATASVADDWGRCPRMPQSPDATPGWRQHIGAELQQRGGQDGIEPPTLRFQPGASHPGPFGMIRAGRIRPGQQGSG